MTLLSICRRRQNKKTIQRKHIQDLPTEILEQIFSNIKIDQKCAIRGTCHRFLATIDQTYQHKFKSQFNKNQQSIEKQKSRSKLCALNEAVYLATKTYCLQLNYAFILSRLLSARFADTNEYGIFTSSLPFPAIRNGLLNFYEVVHHDLICKDDSESVANKLYFLVLLNLLKQFKLSHCGFSWHSSKHLSMLIECKCAWFSTCWTSHPCNRIDSDDRYHLLVMLTHILYGELRSRSFASVWTTRHKVFTYGRYAKQFEPKYAPKILFKMTVVGSKKIIQSLMKMGDINVELLLAEDCCIFMDITCPKGSKLGSEPNYKFDL